MIVQFLNGSQFESSLPIENLPMEIFLNQKELDLKVHIPSQIELLLRPEDSILYAIVKDLDSMEYGEVVDSIANFEEKKKRQELLTLYFQHMAFQSKFLFIRESTAYRIHSKPLGVDLTSISIEEVGLSWLDFDTPAIYVPLHMLNDHPPPGWTMFYHWVELYGEMYAIGTIVNRQDYINNLWVR